MYIFNEEPKNWIELQDMVAYILGVCNYSVETPMRISTVRGVIEVDVYAKSKDSLMICECKHWNSNVPQNIVLAFRTVVADTGANQGMIIAKKGFQKGAYKCAENTNVELLSWKQFLDKYKEKYLREIIRKYAKIRSKLYRVADDKQEYWELYDKLNEKERKEVDRLKNKLMDIVLLMGRFVGMLQYEYDKEIGWSIQYIDEVIKEADIVFEKTFVSYNNFFEYIFEQIYEIVPKLEGLYKVEIL